MTKTSNPTLKFAPSGRWGTPPARSLATLSGLENFSTKPLDKRGRAIQLGSRVRIVGMPDFSNVTPISYRHERNRVFNHIIGQCKTVDDIDQYGLIGMMFKIRKGRDAGIHCIWLEPHFLLVQNVAA